jgi:hypothetical protein
MPPERKQAIHPSDVQTPNSTKSLSLTTPMHTDRREVIDWSSRFPAADDWERWAAKIAGQVRFLSDISFCPQNNLWKLKNF